MALLNYAKSYLSALTAEFAYTLYFGKLYTTPNTGRYRWVNSKSIEIPTLKTTGRTNADRDTIGNASRNYDNDWEQKTLTNQRKWDTLVHPKDIDQTNMVASIANITNTFNTTQKFPEMDAYLISKVYADWTAQSMTADTTALTAANILEEFDKMMLAMDNKRVPVAGRVLYVPFEIKSMLKAADGIQRTLDVQTGASNINRTVTRLDEVEIIPVPSELMKTLYNFTSGWKVDESAKQINMFLVHPIAILPIVSYTFAQLAPPSALSQGKWVYYEEAFEDVFIMNKLKDAIQFNVEA